MFWNGRTAIEGLSGSASRCEDFSGGVVFGWRRGFAWRRLADFERISSDRLGDVLELGRAQIAHREIEPRFHLPIGVFRQTDRARFGNPFKPRGNVDAIAH